MIAYKTSSSAAGEVLFNDIGPNSRGKFEFANSGNSVRTTYECWWNYCSSFNGTTWLDSYYTTQMNMFFEISYYYHFDYLWQNSQYRIVLLDLANAPNVVLNLAAAYYDGQIAEVMIFTPTTTVSNQTFINIGTYLNNKHGTSW